MTTVAKFEVAQLADAVKKAASVAPTKGAAFDKAAGIVFEAGPSGGRVKASNIDVTFNHTIEVVSFEGDSRVWRVPSRAINAMLQNVVNGEGSNGTIDLIDVGDSWLRAKCGKLVAKLAMMDPQTFPVIPLFDPEGMTPGDVFALRAAQVAWACANVVGDRLSGVHADGEHLFATDGYVIAKSPCEITVDEPITALLTPISSLLRSATDVRLRAKSTVLHMCLDPETQVTTTLFADAYPRVQGVLRDDFTHEVSFNKQTFLDVVSGITAIMSNEKQPRLDLWIQEGNLVLDIDGGEQGRTRNEIVLSGDIEGDDRGICVRPKYLTDAVSNARGNYVKLAWGHADDAKFMKSTMRLSDESGYEAHIMPLVKTSGT